MIRFLSACAGRQRDFGLALLNDETAFVWSHKVPQRVGQKVLQSVCLRYGLHSLGAEGPWTATRRLACGCVGGARPTT
jgi:hypothetical protein